MLINCPECDGKVSDQSDVCIHCGFPFGKIKANVSNIHECIIDGEKHDLSHVFELITSGVPNGYQLSRICLETEHGMDLGNRGTLANMIRMYGKVPEVYNSSERAQYMKALDEAERANDPKCPTCGSYNLKKISTTSKAVNTVAFGLLGTKRNKTFHCNNCKYEW